MKTSVIILIVIVALLVIGGAVFYSMQSNQPTMPSSGTTTNQNPNGPDTNAPTPDNTQTNPSGNPKTQNIVMSNFAFSPSTITINKGDTVLWTNQDSASHTVTSDSGSELSSSTLSNGDTYSHTFATAGTYSYHCSIHPMMKATIIVQ